MSECRHVHDGGAYVLGALSPDDRAAFERHVPGCASCSASVRELAGLPGLLARVPAAMFDATEPLAPVPETLLPGLVRRARRLERRRAWAMAALASAIAAVVAVVLALSIGVTPRPQGGAPAAAGPAASATTAVPEPLAPVGAEPISGWVSLTPVKWGTRLDLTCTYAHEPGMYAEGASYAMYVTRGDGSTERVASWRALPGRTMHLAAATSADRGDIAEVDVRTAAGQTVLRLH